MKHWIKREAYIVVKGQSRQFRIVKWIILIIFGALIYVIFGGKMLGQIILLLTVAGIGVHFFFRWKTHGWTRDWGLYKAIKTPFDENF